MAKDRLTIHYLPPYPPDNNPAEGIWSNRFSGHKLPGVRLQSRRTRVEVEAT
ncbi:MULTISPECIES: hypothetical protein [unclassified Streptomyces]|uniref:hypothetical protein n=1 Tax=unclassified Streptomyces TaxID=2593676 RepID=UPI0033A94770